jgi:hypothetical protein
MRFVAALSFTLFIMASSVQAQPTSPAQGTTTKQAGNGARESFRRGEDAYSSGNYEMAISAWNDAYSLDPRPRIQFNLSQAYERLGQLPEAEAALVKFLEKGDPEDPTYEDAKDRLAALRQRLAGTGIVVQGGSEGGLILLDQTDWGRTPRPDRIGVSPGSHTLIVRWPGQPEFRSDVFVPAGQVVEVTLPTAGAPAVAAPEKPASVPEAGPVSAPPKDKKRLLYFGIGGGLAGAGIGMIAYGVARGNAEPDACQGANATYYCNPSDVDAAHRQSVAGYVVGGTLLAGSAALFIVGAVRHGKPHSEQRTSLPACGFGLTSASCSLKF